MKKDDAKRNYELKSDAVEELVGADSGEIPEYSEEELKKYRTKSRIRIPAWLKFTLLKAWFAGAVCYFILWGLGTYLGNLIDMLVVLGVVMGLVTDLLLNNVLRYIESVPGESKPWLMVTKKGIPGLLLNVVYGLLIIGCVFFLYHVLNAIIISITGNADTIPLGVEPVLFGIFCMGFDMLFIGMKRLVCGMVTDAKAAAASKRA